MSAVHKKLISKHNLWDDPIHDETIPWGGRAIHRPGQTLFVAFLSQAVSPNHLDHRNRTPR
jgi:hypothetical protein